MSDEIGVDMVEGKKYKVVLRSVEEMEKVEFRGLYLYSPSGSLRGWYARYLSSVGIAITNGDGSATVQWVLNSGRKSADYLYPQGRLKVLGEVS